MIPGVTGFILIFSHLDLIEKVSLTIRFIAE